MRLHRVRLRNFRGIGDSEVRFSSHGVTVVEGPNEIGKTSIPEGLDLLLKRPDSSGAADIVSAQPVGTDNGPEVEAEMTTGRYRFVYRKRWLSNPETSLDITSPHSEQLSGRAAHDRVQAILAETLDRDLWEALLVQQGSELLLPGFDVPSLVSALDQAASGDEAADEDDDLWNRICAEHEIYWTATGRPRKDRSVSADRVANAREKVSSLDAEIEQLDQDVSRLQDMAVAGQRLAAELHRCERQEQELSVEWNATEQARTEVERLTAACKIAEQTRDRIAGEHRQRRELVAALESRSAERSEIERQVAESEPARAEASDQVERAEAAQEQARAALQAAEAEHERASADRDDHRSRIELAQLSERFERVNEAEEALAASKAVLDAATVDDVLLSGIEEAHLAAERADAAAAAAAASMQTTASRVLVIEVDGEDVELAAGETQQTQVDDETVLVLPGTAEIRVQAGTGSQGAVNDKESARQELRRWCEQAGVADRGEARHANEQRKEAERQHTEAQATIDRDLRDLTADELRSRIEGLTSRIAAYASCRPEFPPPSADFETAKQAATTTEAVLDEKRAALKDCEEARASATLREARLGDSNLAGRLESARDNHRQAESALEAARSERADSEIESELARAEAQAAEAAESRRNAEAKLGDADSGSLKKRLDAARIAQGGAEDDLRSNQRNQDHLRIELSVRGEQGMHTRRSDAAAELEHFEREHERVERKAEAAILLHDTFSQHRQQARSRYSRPFRQQIEQLGRVVFGSSFSVDIDDDLRVVRRTVGGQTLDVGQLSTGALEQLAVICRLACAAIVSPGGTVNRDGCDADGDAEAGGRGAPVIIDDALGWSDPDRLGRMSQAIDAAGQDCQVIILTCSPDRYAGIADATTITLQEQEKSSVQADKLSG